MRTFYFVLILLFLAAIGLFAYQNNEEVTLKYLNQSRTFPLPAVIAVVYVLGMFTGWTVVGFFKRSMQRMSDRRAAR